MSTIHAHATKSHYALQLRADVLSFRTQILREEEEERVDCIVLASRLAAVG